MSEVNACIEFSSNIFMHSKFFSIINSNRFNELFLRSEMINFLTTDRRNLVARVNLVNRSVRTLQVFVRVTNPIVIELSTKKCKTN